MKNTSEIPCRVSEKQARRKKLTHIGEALKQQGDIEGSRDISIRFILDPVTTDSELIINKDERYEKYT